jgi:hypothetical protein
VRILSSFLIYDKKTQALINLKTAFEEDCSPAMAGAVLDVGERTKICDVHTESLLGLYMPGFMHTFERNKRSTTSNMDTDSDQGVDSDNDSDRDSDNSEESLEPERDDSGYLNWPGIWHEGRYVPTRFFTRNKTETPAKAPSGFTPVILGIF